MANLKPRRLAGFLSSGMILAVFRDDKFELLRPPASASVGERVGIENLKNPEQELLLPLLNPKKKILETILPHLATDSDGYACFNYKRLLTSKGPIKSSLKNANIS